MADLRMDELLAGLRAIGESTRLRLLFILSHGEFNVTELTGILGQSQPRVSRHLKLLTEAGLLERHREGSWMLFRLGEEGTGAALAHMIADLLPADDPALLRDLERLEALRSERASAAAAYFRTNAEDWDSIRSLHVAEEDVEQAMADILADAGPIGTLLDLGTGTGRMLELFARDAEHGIGVDLSREMLAVARSNLERAGLKHCQVRHGDLFHLPYRNDSADAITVHQVLHYLEDPERALSEAARVLSPEGQMLVVDFAPHELEFLREGHAHRRLGISDDQFASWAQRAGLKVVSHEQLPPPPTIANGLTVSIWLARPVHARTDATVMASEAEPA
ncbi:ArsR/SmtB family transcription factor [Kaustia mangrovi]|nr:metalloregulator ArsR/SmtB family transcription factor [Kaustia mangrovi]